MADPLSATPNPVLVPIGKSSGQTLLSWAWQTGVVIETRTINHLNTTPLAPNVGWTMFTNKQDGRNVPLDINLGEVKQVRLRAEGFIFGPITIFALIDEPLARLGDPGWIEDQRFDFGGTWCSHAVVTKVPTFMVLQVSRQPPAKIDGRFYVWNPLPDGQTEDLTFSKFHFGLEIDNLLPGTKYHQLIRLSDDTGRWFVYHQTPDDIRPATPDGFTTLRRKMQININLIYCINCGDNSGSSNTNLRLSVFDGQTEVAPGFMQVFDPFENGVNYPSINQQWTLGPKNIGETYNTVIYETEGTDYDGVGETDETAGGLFSGRIELVCPTGRQNEVVIGKSINVTATPSNAGSTLCYQTLGSYDVTYE